MTSFICEKCENELDLDPINDKIVCPHCSNRIIMKERPETVKKVKAR